MKLRNALIALTLPLYVAVAQKASKSSQPTKPVPVPESAPAGATEQIFSDKHYKVSFRTPPGWEVTHKDGQISTFHMDARSAPPQTKLRGAAMIDFNPFPYSTLAGAIFYFSVEQKTTDEECSAQATGFGLQPDVAKPEIETPATSAHKDVQDIAGMDFAHGHDEHGDICIEARDEVYTTWRKHSCYRFDLAMNTFCPEASGAQPITAKQIHDVNQRLTEILSTVTLGWEKSGAHFVPVPDVSEPKPEEKPSPRSMHSATGAS
jgi:hypothetical protein